MSILLVVLMFASLVFVHELGHFLAARRAGIEVEEFGFGFPPRIVGKKIGKTLYSINWLPLGGFVRLQGEDGANRHAGSFAVAKTRSKVAVLLAGVGMNAVTAYLILLILCLTGLPPVLDNQFTRGTPTYAQPKQVTVVGVAKDSPAEKAGLEIGDRISTINAIPINVEQDLFNFTKTHAGQQVMVDYYRDGKLAMKNITLRGEEDGKKLGFLGVTPLVTYKLKYGWNSPLVALGLTGQLIWATLAAFGNLFTGLVAHHQVSDQVTGPVGIVVMLGALIKIGWAYVALMVAQISLSLAVVNVLPLPALDGGRLAMLAFQGRVSQKFEAILHTVGFVALLGLMAIITFVDIRRYF